ncbi:TPA: hypothetical protein DIC20_03510 [Candidatus Dependentiae bacterium]|nr:MAG: hypothetical protein US03_C0001G0089 [candidate division TM6 bacterium GW2011_GWF2_36_131]KKQ03775.1 MAG: hypothetical protein US13_C0001G0115 [candidate division TM6 bacterium GW2011_GWE2_36_25]KKQ19920.1 MAG: hypothetical protein US32_C0003G0037 [candidate division TM6 bacterium GW2011_GWA2_36_9]HBR70541.1 hypothetical protein [Candidatus Dependentiae bacterium]HCU00743.1 hypothetical protein [Candidatus Dependentiae bacterium]
MKYILLCFLIIASIPCSLQADITSDLGLDKLGDITKQIKLDQLAQISTQGLEKLNKIADTGLDKVVEITKLDELEGLSYDLINKIKITEGLKKLGLPNDAANFIGFPFDVLGSLGKDFLRNMAGLPSQVIETTKTLVSLMTDPRKAAEYAKKWLELFKQLGQMENGLHLCHGGCGVDILLRNVGLSEPIHDGLTTVKEFLDANKDEVIFIFIEDNVKNGKAIDEQINKSGLSSHILKPSDWDPAKEGGWPTFGWLRKNNKRLILFTSSDKTANTSADPSNPTPPYAHESQYIWLQWPHVAEGGYSTIGDLSKKGPERFTKVCVQRGASANYASKIRYMNLLNLFPEAPIPLDAIKAKDIKRVFDEYNKFNDSSTINSSDTLKQFVDGCLKYGIGPEKNQGSTKNRYPNFIALDYVDQGNPMEAINWINQKVLDALKTGTPLETIFPPIVEAK